MTVEGAREKEGCTERGFVLPKEEFSHHHVLEIFANSHSLFFTLLFFC